MRSLRIPDGCRGSSQVHALCPVDSTDSSFQPTSTGKGERLTPEDTVPSPRFLPTHILCNHLILFGVLRHSQVKASLHFIIRSFESDSIVKKFTYELFFSFVSFMLVAHSLAFSFAFEVTNLFTHLSQC